MVLRTGPVVVTLGEVVVAGGLIDVVDVAGARDVVLAGALDCVAALLVDATATVVVVVAASDDVVTANVVVGVVGAGGAELVLGAVVVSPGLMQDPGTQTS